MVCTKNGWALGQTFLLTFTKSFFYQFHKNAFQTFLHLNVHYRVQTTPRAWHITWSLARNQTTTIGAAKILGGIVTGKCTQP